MGALREFAAQGRLHLTQTPAVREVLEFLARSIVGDPDAVVVDEVQNGSIVRLRLSVAPEDVGKVIGKGGRTVRAIRDVVRAAATREGVSVTVEIVE